MESAYCFFLIPGVVAYIVDYSTGAIYLPPDEKPKSDKCDFTVADLDDMIKIETGDKHLSSEKIEAVILRELGIKFDMEDERLEVSPVK